MTSHVRDIGTPQLDEQGRIALGLPCSECRYELKGLDPDGLCPECGYSIQTTVKGELQKRRRYPSNVTSAMVFAVLGFVAPFMGIAAVWPHGVSGFLNYRAMVGYTAEYSQTLTAGVRIEL